MSILKLTQPVREAVKYKCDSYRGLREVRSSVHDITRKSMALPGRNLSTAVGDQEQSSDNLKLVLSNQHGDNGFLQTGHNSMTKDLISTEIKKRCKKNQKHHLRFKSINVIQSSTTTNHKIDYMREVQAKNMVNKEREGSTWQKTNNA